MYLDYERDRHQIIHQLLDHYTSLLEELATELKRDDDPNAAMDIFDSYDTKISRDEAQLSTDEINTVKADALDKYLREIKEALYDQCGALEKLRLKNKQKDENNEQTEN
jgi:hypothetical protein